MAADPPEPVIEIRDLKTCFGSVCIHEDLNLEVRRGEIVALVDEPGPGAAPRR